MKYEILGEQEMFDLGKGIAPKLKNIILLYGELGAGKTVLSKGVFSYFGIDKDDVHSPTFAIVNQYADNLFHFDAYRINSKDWYNQGFNEYCEEDNICVIEWAENLDKDLFSAYSSIKIQGSGNEKRIVDIAF